MYQHTVSPFGKYEVHAFRHPATGNGFSLVPAHGGCLLDLTFGGQSVLDGYRTPQEVDFDLWSKSAVLYPFPNRLREGAYTWEGKSYQFPVNDTVNGHALHGFGADRPMTVDIVDTSETEAFVLCADTYLGDNPAFPFPFTFHLMYHLEDEGRAFTVTLSVENDGPTAMPFGFGWHPYFRLAPRADEVWLQLPPCDMVGIDQTMIPTGKRYGYEEFAALRRLGATVLDNAFYVGGRAERAEAVLKGAYGTLRYWQETGPGHYDFLQVFTPPHRESIALEPMTCNVDAFHNGQGLLSIPPQGRASADFGVVFG